METNEIHITKKSVVAFRPTQTKNANSVWYVDLIIMDKPIFTCVDAFSKYAWVRIVLKNKTANEVAKHLDNII